MPFCSILIGHNFETVFLLVFCWCGEPSEPPAESEGIFEDASDSGGAVKEGMDAEELDVEFVGGIGEFGHFG